jgi:hypothetical protein
MTDPLIVLPKEPIHRIKQLALLRADYQDRKARMEDLNEVHILDFRIIILDYIAHDKRALYTKVIEDLYMLHPAHTLDSFEINREWTVIESYVENGGGDLVNWGKGGLDTRYPIETLE